MFAARHPAEVPKVVNLAGRFRTREGTLARFGADILSWSAWQQRRGASHARKHGASG